MGFVDIETLSTSEEQLFNQAIAKLKELLEAKGYAGWEANEADLATILLKTIASLLPPVAQIAASAPPAIFRRYGTELLNLPYNEGAAATGATKWTLKEEGGKFPARTIEAGTQLTIGETVFYVQSNVVVAEGSGTANVTVVAAERGTEANGLTGVMELVDGLTWVSEVKLAGETTGGVAQESDEEYENRLAAALALQAPRPITASNFAELVLTAPSSLLPAGVIVGRATSIDGYNPATVEPEGKVTNGSAVMTEITSFTGITVGSEIIGANVPKGTVVAKLTAGEEAKNELTMSAKATGSPAKGKYKFVGSYGNSRYTATFVANREGAALSGEAMTKLEEWLASYRELNFQSPVLPPTVNEVFVKTKIHLLPGYTEATVKANVEAAVKAFLSPAKWGNLTGGTTGVTQWINYVVKGGVGERLNATVRYNQLLGVIENVAGVAYVFPGAGGLEQGLEAGAKGTTDLAMVGAAPLPTLKTLTIEVG